MPQVARSLGTAIALYFSNETYPPPDIALQIFDAADDTFDLSSDRVHGRRAHAESSLITSGAREWFAQNIEDASVRVNSGAAHEDYTIATSRGRWYITADNLGSSKVLCGVSFSRDAEQHVGRFVASVIGAVVFNKRHRYGYVDMGPWGATSDPAFLNAHSYSDLRWEDLVEVASWSGVLQSNCQTRVRNIYWANIFGPEMTKRLKDAGFDETMKELEEEWGGKPIVRTSERGAMAVMLDDDPLGFARNREQGLDMMSNSVLVGAALRTVLSRAQML